MRFRGGSLESGPSLLIRVVGRFPRPICGSGALRKRGKSSGPCGPRRIASEKIPSFHFIAADAKLFVVQSVVRQQFPALISSGHDEELRDFSALSAPLLLANLWRKRHFPRKSLR